MTHSWAGDLWPRHPTQCGDGLQAGPRKVHLITRAVAFVGGCGARAQAGQSHFLLDLRRGLPVLQRPAWEGAQGSAEMTPVTQVAMGASVPPPTLYFLQMGLISTDERKG